mmetsp:Transcript_12568/g.29785  ORF Transcript_12568/g.29785 Transcript_12568/m.29785 type:complete len:232 (+) Transcript_12568:859-1554(+)
MPPLPLPHSIELTVPSAVWVVPSSQTLRTRIIISTPMALSTRRNWRMLYRYRNCTTTMLSIPATFPDMPSHHRLSRFARTLIRSRRRRPPKPKRLLLLPSPNIPLLSAETTLWDLTMSSQGCANMLIMMMMRYKLRHPLQLPSVTKTTTWAQRMKCRLVKELMMLRPALRRRVTALNLISWPAPRMSYLTHKTWRRRLHPCPLRRHRVITTATKKWAAFIARPASRPTTKL